MVKYGGTGEMLEDGAAEPDEGSPADKEMDYKAILAEILAREKVIKSEWLDKTKESYEIYDGSKSDTIPFNILYSNTEILVPNLFSASPKPIVRRRFGEMRADGASKAAERMAEYCMDTNLSGYPDFVDALESCVLDAALPGQGQARVRLVNDTAVIDYVQHDAFIWAYAKRWEDTGWIAYRHDKTVNDTKADLALEPDVAAGLKSPSLESSSSMKDKGPETIAVYEIWDKRSRMVHFCTEGHPDIVIKSMEDPLGLEGFFPSGKPLRLLSTPISTMPRSMYNLYRKQAMELNEVTRRITNLTKAIQVRGIYDGNIAEMANLFSMENSENKLTASNNPGTLLRDGGLDKHIWLVPVEKYVTVLAQLFVIRDQIKNTIYEILGIGDILRGVTKASETLGAQEIKDKWGTLRIKRSRERVSTFVRQQIRFLIEVSAKHVPEQIWAQVTGLPYVSSMEAQMQPQLPPPGPQGPPQPPQMVSWGEVL